VARQASNVGKCFYALLAGAVDYRVVLVAELWAWVLVLGDAAGLADAAALGTTGV
jgi:hypothetical protein